MELFAVSFFCSLHKYPSISEILYLNVCLAYFSLSSFISFTDKLLQLR